LRDSQPSLGSYGGQVANGGSARFTRGDGGGSGGSTTCNARRPYLGYRYVAPLGLSVCGFRPSLIEPLSAVFPSAPCVTTPRLPEIIGHFQEMGGLSFENCQISDEVKCFVLHRRLVPVMGWAGFRLGHFVHRRLPARLNAEQAAWVLNCQPHDVPILVAARLVKPLGNQAQNGIKFFATSELLELAKGQTWLVNVMNAVNQHWHWQNARKKNLLADSLIYELAAIQFLLVNSHICHLPNAHFRRRFRLKFLLR
jgi:hypothetical protein